MTADYNDLPDNELPGMWERADFIGGKTDMTTDNKDAALELASELDIINYVDNPDDLCKYYNAARKPLEEDIERFKQLSGIAAEFDASPDDAEFEPHHPVFMMAQENDNLRQQLLATQEAYQRVAKALRFFNFYDAALANPPSMEALERKKLEDEIAVLDDAIKVSNLYLYPHICEMIAERKEKLEKLK